jgi:hypothetical protein
VGQRWIVLGVLVACVLAVLSTRSHDPSLLQDSDTRAILTALRQRDDPWSWFVSDWPLQNHFYRPIVALSFEWDWRMWGDQAAGYGWTNAILAAACVLTLAWLVWELFRASWQAGLAACLLTVWLRDAGPILAEASTYVAWATLFFGLILRRRLGWPLIAAVVLWFLGSELSGISHLLTRVVQWLPGRTASLMALFCLVALASYARYVRIVSRRPLQSESKPTDPPPTKSTRAIRPRSRYAWVWMVVSLLATALALASYEQAVMLPLVVAVAAWVLDRRGYRASWWWLATFWAVLVLYVVVRATYVSLDPSDYQLQQLRTGPGVRLSLLEYFLPGLLALQPIWINLELGMGVLWVPQFYAQCMRLVSFLVTSVVALRSTERPDVIGGWLMSGLAFLPLAWAKHFDHYHFWPMALRTILLVALFRVAGRAMVNAVSRPALQAPPRRDPAPGSLPHP